VALTCVAGMLVSAGAAQAASCASNTTPALKWEVVGSGTTRGISLVSTEKGFQGSAIFPASVTIFRGGETIQKTFTNRSAQFVYRARRGEQVRALAVYSEDASGYGATQFGVQQITPVTLPAPVASLLTLPSLINIKVPFPATPVGLAPAFGSNLCTRSLGALVAEKARSSRSHAARFRVTRRR
jgi:hypothetical protein